MGERTEALMRIVVGIVSGIIFSLWKVVIQILALVHWVVVIITGERIKGISSFSNTWATEIYRFVRYMTFATNARPFPFTELAKELQPVDMKKKR